MDGSEFDLVGRPGLAGEPVLRQDLLELAERALDEIVLGLPVGRDVDVTSRLVDLYRHRP